MPPETAQTLSPEQRMARLFEQEGMDAMDGSGDSEDRTPDAQRRGAAPEGQAQADPESEDKEAAKAAEDEDSGQADPDSGDTGDESADSEGSQEPEGIETTVLASLLGIEDEGITVDEEGRPLFKVKVDGEDRNVPFSELSRGYSGQEVFTRKTQELAEHRQQFEQQRQQEIQDLTARAQVVDQVLQEHQQEVLDQYGREDWDKLRAEQPHEFAARRTEYAELYQKMEQRRQAVQSRVMEVHQRAQQDALEQRNRIAVDEGRKLRAAVREWDTEEKAAQGAKAIQDFLLNQYGFTPQDLDNTLNHRAYLVALDAMRWRLQQKQVEPTKQRIVKAPRVMKSGTPATEGDRRRTQAARAVKRHKHEGSVESAAAALLARNLV